MPHQSIPPAHHEDWMLGPFVREDALNPCLGPRAASRFFCPIRGSEVDWEAKDVFNPAAVVRDGVVYLLYRAEDTVGRFAGTSRIGLAKSSDGRRFTRHPQPVLFPDHDAMTMYEWEGGCEDPRVVEAEDGRYVMTYTAFDGQLARLAVATSRDLVQWQKHGLVFGATEGGRYANVWSKSGAIVCRQEDDRLIATRIAGRYWMYWGELNMSLATSDDLLNWDVVYASGSTSELYVVFGPRIGQFDSELVEPGPPAVLREQGIVLLYNNKNSGQFGDPALPANTYAPAQVLLDPHDPRVVLRRSTAPFMIPERSYEITGQIGDVCFVVGLVPFGDEWLLYYGTADSFIAVASA